MSILATVLGISLLIVLHELGHFWAARLCGMRVRRFSIGFGPVLFGKQWGETYFQIAIIPFGGFVLIDGLGPTPEETPFYKTDPHSFNNKPYWQRAFTLIAGPLMNWLVAAVFIFLIAYTVGFHRPNLEQNQIGEVVPKSAASAAGLQSDDFIQVVNNVPTQSWEALVTAIRSYPDQTIPIEIQREDQVRILQLTPEKSPRGEYGVIGVGPMVTIEKFGFIGSLKVGVRGAWNMLARTTSLLLGMLQGSQEGQLSGIPGIVKMVSQQAQRGIGRLLEALASLSVGLCLLNLIPFPALDGGRLVFLAIEAARKQPLPRRFELIANAIGFLLLFALMIVVSIRDVVG